MGESKPRHIVCAVRGRPHSRRTVSRAIDLAVEAGARLTFFYAVDVEFKGRAPSGGTVRTLYRELVEMSQFLMLILIDRAQRRGVAEVDAVVREGAFRRQLHGYLAESSADLLVLGWPSRGGGQAAFKPAEIEAFVAELEREEQLRVVVVPPLEDGSL
jgi:nucleotide-binding universal stress UspA family protein